MTEQDIVNLAKLAEQQKIQLEDKIRNRSLKQTHDKNLAESFRTMTNQKS